MERVKRERTTLRTGFTRIANLLKTQLSEKDTDVVGVEVNWTLLTEKHEALRRADAEVMEHMLNEDASLETMRAEDVTCDEYASTFNRLKIEYRRYCHPTEEVLSQSAYGTEHMTSVRKFKLPVIEFKKFTGEIKEWLPFWGQFKKIDEDESIVPEDKFQYLIQATATGSRARELVNSYPPTAENYPKAVESLKSRFGREDMLIEVYVRELLKLVLSNALCKNQKTEIASLHDKIETQLRALETLGITTEAYASMLYPLVESCLPEELLRVWQRSDNFSNSGDSVQQNRLQRLMLFIKTEIESEERISLAVEGFSLGDNDNKSVKRNKPKSVEPSMATAAGLMNLQVSKCLFCNGAHATDNCFKAQKFSFEQKQKILKDNRACFRCAKTGHQSRKCHVQLVCVICGGKHIVLLCPSLSTVGKLKKPCDSAETNVSRVAGSEKTDTLANHTDTQVFLQTLLVKIRGVCGTREVRAIIDSGSQRSYILKETATTMQYTPKRVVKIVHALFGGANTNEQPHACYDVTLLSLDEKYSCTFEALDQPTICNGITTVFHGVWTEELRRMNIEISDTRDAAPIEILLGADVIGNLYTGRIRRLNCGLAAMQTLLGWTVMGKIPERRVNQSSTLFVTALLSSESMISNLWQLDVLGIEDPAGLKSRAEVENAVKDFFSQTIDQNEEGRYEVRMPWIEGHPPLPSNYSLCKKRLESTEKRLTATGCLQEYEQIFAEWLEMGIIEEVPQTEIQNVAHYLPHRPVLKPNSTTKMRPVFDASARENNKPALNHCIEKGINLIELIPSILLRFRKDRIGVISDIRKAFLQISLCNKDRDFLRFLWRRADGSEIIFRHTRVVFGVNCSPFLLGATIDYHLRKCLTQCDNAEQRCSKETILKLLDSFYVDNCVASLPDMESLSKFIREATQIMAAGKFDLRGWEFSGDTDGESEATNVLGLTWNKETDTLSIHEESHVRGKDDITTKRTILSTAQKVFDPIGFTCPATLSPKLLLQRLWETKIGWDEEVDEESAVAFRNWCEELPLLPTIQIPRWVMWSSERTHNLSLHVFCDASKDAYACAVFLRVNENGLVRLFLLQSRTRVSPLKKLTIPRLELLAATIGARLYNTIKDNSSRDIETYFWSDSSVVLAWIKRPDKWSTFVWNRTQEIRLLTSQERWRHVPGDMNPADLPSRGCSPKKLLESRWWEGPKWLCLPQENWPPEDSTSDELEIQKERKKGHVTSLFNNENEVWYGQYFSRYNKIVRMISWMRRFHFNCLNPENRRKGELSAEELEKGEENLILMIQREFFLDKEDKRLSSICIHKDENGLLRVKTKISNREDAYDFRFPYVLPAKHTVVKKLIFDLHVKSCHIGLQGMMSILREKYWILGGRRTIRSAISKCVPCIRHSCKKPVIPTPPLPMDRVRDAASFEVTGIDLAGPVYLRNQEKVWICLFTCGVYRGIHLDLVTSLTTNNFLLALRRFISRRGRPRVIFSDNGTNFVGAENAFSQLDWKMIAQFSSAQRITWRFNPPSAPWWGGWWERLIGLVKQLLKRVLGRAKLNSEEFYTLLCDCESVINARPLTYVTNEQSDLVPLTPAMFMRDLVEAGVPDCDLSDITSLNRRLKYLQNLREDLRRRFRSEYLGQLRQQFVAEKSRSLSIGDIVLIGNDNSKRMDWPLGRVVELIPGNDTKVRLIRVQTSSGLLLRPIQRVYPLECVEDIPVSNAEDGYKTSPDPEAEEDQVPDVSPGDPTPVSGDVKASVRRSRFGRVLKSPDRYIP